ncbi:hypothetical protein H0X06_01170 [Candidatus Dependentiae bacterium]|nr:hypothetical protein [Candidatus Dependentiae bacterium]
MIRSFLLITALIIFSPLRASSFCKEEECDLQQAFTLLLKDIELQEEIFQTTSVLLDKSNNPHSSLLYTHNNQEEDNCSALQEKVSHTQPDTISLECSPDTEKNLYETLIQNKKLLIYSGLFLSCCAAQTYVWYLESCFSRKNVQQPRKPGSLIRNKLSLKKNIKNT